MARRPDGSARQSLGPEHEFTTDREQDLLVTERVIGVIGGSGLYRIDGLADVEWRRVESPFGRTSDEFFAGHQIKMPPPLTQTDQVKFADGTQATVPQMAHDVVNFLSWAAEPTLDERHRMGFKVILFLIIATGVFYAAKRKIWSRIH
ncbi:MAG: hypothetical protein JO162_00230 [Alphaproteobacteria bacterium]|nr:hypothetical protein [Alphaproteobacteria bacterium]